MPRIPNPAGLMGKVDRTLKNVDGVLGRVDGTLSSVDGTLTRRDCVFPFLWRLGGMRLVLGLARRAPSVIAAAVRRDRDRLK